MKHMNLTTLKEEARAEFYQKWPSLAQHAGANGFTNDFIDTLIDRTYHATKEEVRGMPAFKNLKEEQGQLDEDGIMVVVSRQALDELISALEDTTTSPND